MCEMCVARMSYILGHRQICGRLTGLIFHLLVAKTTPLMLAEVVVE
jgi:hypothetical protein